MGAGPVGLFLANECQRRGLRWRLVEARSTQSEHSKALAIFPRTLEILDMAGLVGPFMAAANKVTSVAVIAHGRTLARMPFAPGESPYPLIAMVPQNVTERLLVEQLQQRGGAVEYATSFVTAVEHDDVVTVTLDTNGERRQVRAAFVVGCDGAHSAIRHLLKLSFEGAQYDDLFMLADIETNEALPPDQLQLCPSEFGPLAIFPMSPIRRRVVATVRSAERRRAIAGAGAVPAGGACAGWTRSTSPALEQLLPHPPSACRAAALRAYLHRRRRCAHSQSVRRTGNEHRSPRRLESGVEARSRPARS